MYDTGVSAGRIVLRAMRGEIRPVMAWGNRPLMPHTLCMGTDDAPMRELIDMTREAESRGVLMPQPCSADFRWPTCMRRV